MYAGMITSNHSARWLGAHQKLNRLAYHTLCRYLMAHKKTVVAHTQMASFPSLKSIQYFEGANGPDGMKFKSPGRDEPWHFYNPYDERDTGLLKLLEQHKYHLIKSIREDNQEKAAFEAAWQAHAIVDGMTPAHHYPYEEEMELVRGDTRYTRTSGPKKFVARGLGRKDTLQRNWKILGRKGIMSTHINFEAGVASVLLPARRAIILSDLEVAYALEHGLSDLFRLSARSVADLNFYERFYKYGWTVRLTKDVRSILIPQIAKTVSLAWLLALEEKPD